MRRLIDVDVRAGVAWAFAGLCVLVLVAAILVGLYTQASATRKIATEGVERRNETCRLFERQELTNVNRVIRTYAYLDELPRDEWGSTLTVAIVRGLAAQREDAVATVAPSYCTEAKGQPLVGLPESSKYQIELPPERHFRPLLKSP